MRKSFNSEEWLKIVGKEKLQAFQDAFARLYGVGTSFKDLEGKDLTVPSNEPMLCHTMKEHQEQRCNEEECMCLRSQTKINRIKVFNCYTGLEYAVCPVFFNGAKVAFVLISGVAYQDCSLPKEVLDKYGTVLLSPKQLMAICDVLEKSLELLNIDLNNMMSVIDEKTEKDANNDVFSNKLSKREEEIARLICQGLSNRAIAERLFISEKTVKTHVSNILLKLDIKDRMQLVVGYCKNIND